MIWKLFSALLCVADSPHNRSILRSIGDICVVNLLNEQLSCWWFGTPWSSYDGTVRYRSIGSVICMYVYRDIVEIKVGHGLSLPVCAFTSNKYRQMFWPVSSYYVRKFRMSIFRKTLLVLISMPENIFVVFHFPIHHVSACFDISSATIYRLIPMDDKSAAFRMIPYDSLVQMMACRLVGAKLSSERMPENC